MIALEATIEGTLVRLRPVEERDLPLFMHWLNDSEVRQWQHRSEMPLETLQSQLKRLDNNRADDEHRGWCIETLDRLPIGNIGLVGVDPIHGRAELYIFIGEKDYWSKGYGAEAISLVLRHSFERLGLRRIELITDIDNARGIRCYEKCGFVREGVLRQHRLRYGKPLDMLQMAVLRDEWEGL